MTTTNHFYFSSGTVEADTLFSQAMQRLRAYAICGDDPNWRNHRPEPYDVRTLIDHYDGRKAEIRQLKQDINGNRMVVHLLTEEVNKLNAEAHTVRCRRRLQPLVRGLLK